MTAVKEKAYAKINLYLDVIGIREDGFHDIETVMHSVSLYDEITVSVIPARSYSVRMQIDCTDYLPTDSKNLAVKAANLFCSRLGIKDEILIKIKKNIPIAAGLAGGSSDAAAVLRALNKIYKRPFTKSSLAALSAELGSDVPYCVFGKTALCEGRGEKVTRILTEPKLNVVIACANEHISTPEAYRMLDDKYERFSGNIFTGGEGRLDSLVSSLSKQDSVDTERVFNIFESVILPICDGARDIKNILIDHGALCAIMSGSGPSVFAIFKTKCEAEKATKTLIEKKYRAWSTTSV